MTQPISRFEIPNLRSLPPDIQEMIRAVQEMVFHAPLTVGSDFAVFAREAGRGRTSFTLELAGIADPDGARTPIATARFIMVAVDDAGSPRALAA